MGLARHKGEVRLGLSATVASVVLYSAIVLFGVGSASPSATDATRDPQASAPLRAAARETAVAKFSSRDGREGWLNVLRELGVEISPT